MECIRKHAFHCEERSHQTLLPLPAAQVALRPRPALQCQACDKEQHVEGRGGPGVL